VLHKSGDFASQDLAATKWRIQKIHGIVIDGWPKPENVQENMFDGIFCYKLPTFILIENVHL
jgi:hypothetical protein